VAASGRGYVLGASYSLAVEMSGKVVAAVGGVAAAAGLMAAYIARGTTLSEGVHYITTNDGVRLAYEVRGLAGPTVVLIHGWSGSRRYFDLNVKHLAQSCRVVLVDLRFHGDSDKPEWGFHVARLAADLNDLLSQTWIGATKPALLGSSLGCAVIWSYVELYGQASVSKLIFVDQAPSQWVYPDWKLGSKGIYDPPSLINIQNAVKDLNAFADGNAACCLTRPVPPATMTVLKAETMRCVPSHLAKLMADHAPIDWRAALSRISVPSLNMYGSDSGCFPPGGCATVGELIGHRCEQLEFDGCNHWLYLEAPERFNQAVGDFLHSD